MKAIGTAEITNHALHLAQDGQSPFMIASDLLERFPDILDRSEAVEIGSAAVEQARSKSWTAEAGRIVPTNRKAASLKPITAQELDHMNIPSMNWIVEDILPVGVAMLAAPPKYFKSYLALGNCVAVCQGKRFLGFKSNRAACLYFDLESTERRPRDRLNQILGSGSEKPDNLFIVPGNQEIAKIGKGFEDQLEEILEAHPEIKLVVIDVFNKIRLARGKKDPYERDYEDIAALKKIADRHEICILLIHHTTKMKREDPFDSITGSVGVVGSLDCAWTITKKDRQETEGELHITGRDLETRTIPVAFDQQKFIWQRLKSPEELEELREQTEYVNSNIVKTIKELSSGWRGSADQLIQESILRGFPISHDAAAVGKLIRKYTSRLESDGIGIKSGRTASGRYIDIRKIYK